MRGRVPVRVYVSAFAGLVLCAAMRASLGCSTKVCDDVLVNGLTITVVNAETNQPLCGALVVVTDGAFRETLTEHGDADGDAGDGSASSCLYTGAAERPGTYALTASAPGFETGSLQGIVVPSGECHVVTQTVTIHLEAGAP